MPRYYFHIKDGQEHHDHEGVELPDLEAAETMAAKSLAEYVKDHPRDLWDDGEVVMLVNDERGLTLLTIYVAAHHAPAAIGQRPAGAAL